MLPAAHRLTDPAGFRAAARGRRAGARTLVVHVADDRTTPVGDGSGPVVGFVVSRAVGGAVQRNRVRRRLRHLVRARLASLPGGVVTVRALPPSSTAGSQELGADLDRCLERVRS